MRICILGKYPPIEGGVSTHTYWLARGLASRGHVVHVVTNADEVEATYRMSLDPDDWRHYAPRFENGGGVFVYNPMAYSQRTMLHIPEANPFVSKLASVATETIRRHDCQVILAYYYEPYAVAGYLASRFTGRPLVIKHAGSDLDRLLRIPDLATTYKEILRAADGVVSRPRLMSRFLGMGVARDKLERDVPYGVPTEVFHPGAEPMDLARAALTPAESPGDGHDELPRAAPFDRSLPTVGVYGKIGTQKGTLDLLAALGALAAEDCKVNLVAMIGRAQARWITGAVRKAGLEERTYVLPLVPNWRVPGFLRACTAVCFLERDFQVKIHGPGVPREVLACGTCLVVSGEIVAKQWQRERWRHGDNVIVVDDPQDHGALTAAIRSLVADPGLAARIGAQGALLVRGGEDYHHHYITGWEELLARRAAPPAAAAGATPSPPTRAAVVESAIPQLVALARRRLPQILDTLAAPAGNGADPVVELCDRIIEATGPADSEEMRRILALARYARLRALAGHDDPAGEEAAPFPVMDRLRGEAVTRQSTRTLRPTRGRTVWVAEFAFDVAAFFAASAAADPSELPEEKVILLFHRSVNLIRHELRIDEPMAALLAACDGSRTTAEVVAQMCQRFGAGDASGGERSAALVLQALDWLYQEGLIVFGEYRDDWGWTGGRRWLPGALALPEGARS